MKGLERISHLLAADVTFRQAFLADNRQALAAWKLELNAEETKALETLVSLLALATPGLVVRITSANLPLWNGVPPVA